jgi:predicted dehydrogenase
MLCGAIIGFGKIAQTAHLPAYADAKVSSRAQIIAVAEPYPAYRDKAVELIPGVRTYESMEKLLADEKLDFIDICTPPDLHLSALRAGVSAGLHLVCEKPFAPTSAEAADAASLLTAKPQLVFMPCHQYRYSPVWTPFREMATGVPAQSKIVLQFNVYRTQADPGYLATNPNWRTDHKVSGGGILADTGVHYIYLSSWILGTPLSVSAITQNIRHHDLAVEDTVLAVITCERGISQITLTWGADRRANSARLVCADGSLIYDGSRLERWNQHGSEVLPVPDASDKTQYARLYISLFDEFIDRVERRENSRNWICEAKQSIDLLDACYRSARTGQTVTLDGAVKKSVAAGR